MVHNHVDKGVGSDVDDEVAPLEDVVDLAINIQMFGQGYDVVKVHNPVIEQPIVEVDEEAIYVEVDDFPL